MGFYNFMLPLRARPLERDQYFSKMGHSKLHPNKDHTLVGAPKSPPCCIHLYGSAVMIQTIWGAEWICRDPGEEAGHPQPLLTALFSSPPRSGSIPSVPWGSPLKKATSFTKILQHMLPSFPQPPTIKREHKVTVTDRWADSHYFGLSVRGEWVQEERGAVQMFWSNIMIMQISHR